MKQIILFSMIMIFCLSCRSKQSETSQRTLTTVKDSTIQTKPITFNVQNFPDFWILFRQAMLSMDTTTLISCTNVPLEIYGMEDRDPRLKITKNKIVFVLEEFLKTDYNESSNMDFLKAIEDVEKSNEYDSASIEYQRVGDMQFKKKNNEWKLTLIYMDTKDPNFRKKISVK